MGKKLLLVSPFYYGTGGVESSLNTLVSLLRRRGWSVDLCVLGQLPPNLYERIEHLPFLAIPLLLLPLLKQLRAKRVCMTHAAGLAAAVVCYLSGRDYVVSTHAIYNGIRKFSWIEKKALQKAKVVICLGEESRKEVLKAGAENTVTYKTLIDWELFKPMELKKTFKALFLARPIAKKGWDEVNKIEGVAKFSDVPNHELPSLYNQAEVTLTAAQYPECFSRVILESLFCDTPVIASNLDVAKDIIPNDVVKFVEPTAKSLSKTLVGFKRKSVGYYRAYAMKEFGPDNVSVFEKAYSLPLVDSRK